MVHKPLPHCNLLTLHFWVGKMRQIGAHSTEPDEYMGSYTPIHYQIDDRATNGPTCLTDFWNPDGTMLYTPL